MPLEFALNSFPWIMGLSVALLFFSYWIRDRRYERELKLRELERQDRREAEEIKRREEEAKRLIEERDDARSERWSQEKKEEEALVRTQAGVGTGGYIYVDLPDKNRSLFQDLLKGFEEYARLKGYAVSFSADTTFNNKIAFKFSLTDPDVVVGTDRVRKDLREYIDKVTRGDSLDDLPHVISIEEHDLLITTLKNRISFLQHNFNLEKNSKEFYQNLIFTISHQRVLSPSIVVQTGGAYNAASYSALNSPQAVLGIENSSSKNSIRIAITYKERKEQIDLLSEVLRMLEKETPETERDQAIRNLSNVKEELEGIDPPEQTRVGRWLERAKQSIQMASLGEETVTAAKELFRLFGIV